MASPSSSGAAPPGLPGQSEQADFDLLDLIKNNTPVYSDPDQLLKEIEEHPFFMTELPKDPSKNEHIMALQALAYEGERWEVADNFKSQGNECVRASQWKDAAKFYSQGVTALDEESTPAPPAFESGEPELLPAELADKEKTVRISLLLNRSLANYKLANFRAAGSDASIVLRTLDPTNIKAFYRLAQAHYALGRPGSPAANPGEHLSQSLAALKAGLSLHPNNTDLVTLKAAVEKTISDRAAAIAKAQKERLEEQQKAAALISAKQTRQLREIKTTDGPATADNDSAVIRLSDPKDSQSDLLYPVMVFYPTASQTDMLTDVSEHATIDDILHTILSSPPEWATKPDIIGLSRSEVGDFAIDAVSCFADVADRDGKVSVAGTAGVVRLGRSISLAQAHEGGKIPVRDGIIGLFVVPKERESGWLADLKERRHRL